MADQTPPSYNVGDVVNGHMWNGSAWVPVAPAPASVKAKKPIYRRWWAIAGMALIALIVIVSITGGGGDDNTVSSNPPAADAPAADEPKADEPKDEEPVAEEPAVDEPSTPGIGDKVRDGKFEFTVTKVKTGVGHVGSEFLDDDAQGSFTLVTMTVENIGDESQTFFSDNVSGTDSKGRDVSSDSTATLYANEGNDAWISEINPGNSIEATVVFDVAKGIKLETVELHDSAFSGGVTVTLK